MKEFKPLKSSVQVLFSLSILLSLAACGSGTTISSAAFDPGTVSGITQFAFSPLAANVSSFKICVGKIRLENENGEAQGGDELGEITFEPGLIDLSDGQEKYWGNVELPDNFVLKTIKIVFKNRPELCGSDWALNFNGVTTTEEMEAKWRINPPQVFRNRQQIRIPMQAMVNALISEAGNGTLTQETLKQAVEAAEDTFELLDE